MPPFIIKEGTNYVNMLGGTNPNLKICIIDITSQRLLSLTFNNFDCSEKCFGKTYKYDLNEKICIEFCNLSYYQYDYNDFCHYRCPNSTFEPDDKEFFCLDKNPEDSYYFNITKEVFKTCHTKCKSCNEGGDETKNNCIECKDGYIFLNESFIDSSNCFNECPHYYYFNEYGNYSCTDTKVCHENFNRLIPEKKKCIDERQNDNYYRFEYNNTCY